MRTGLPAGERRDFIQPFSIEGHGVRGRLVRLSDVVDRIGTQHAYPDSVAKLLAEMMVLSAVLAAALKYEGVFTLQTKGDGPIKLMVVDITSEGAMRGYAQFDADKVAALGRSGELIKELGIRLEDAPEPFYLMTGAFELVARMARWLAPGASGIITEFGEYGIWPKLSTHLDHPELSIHFGQLHQAAKAAGLEANLSFVIDLLDGAGLVGAELGVRGRLLLGASWLFSFVLA